MAKPQRHGVGGASAGGDRAAPRSRRSTIPAPANDNRLGVRRLLLRVLPALAAIALLTVLIRYALG